MILVEKSEPKSRSLALFVLRDFCMIGLVSVDFLRVPKSKASQQDQYQRDGRQAVSYDPGDDCHGVESIGIQQNASQGLAFET